MQSYFGHIFLPIDNDFLKIEGVRLFIDWVRSSYKPKKTAL